MLIHFRSGQKWDGTRNTQILLKKLMPFAKNTKVVIAHMADWGGYDKATHAALGLIAAYIHQNNSYSKNLYLELSAVFPLSPNEDYKKPVKTKTDWHPVTALKMRIRQIGLIIFFRDRVALD